MLLPTYYVCLSELNLQRIEIKSEAINFSTL